MAQFKTVWSFFGEAGDQFSDVHYREATTLLDATNFKSGTIDLIEARRQFLDDQNTLKSIRVSQVGASRVAQTVPVNLGGLQGIGTVGGPAQAGAAVIWSINGTTGGSRKWWIRGYTGNAVDTDPTTGNARVGPNMAANIKAFIRYMGSAGFGILKLTPLPRDPANFVPIVSVAANANPAYTDVTLQAAIAGLVAGNRVLVQGTSKKDFPGLTGSFQVTLVAGPVLTIKYRLPPYNVAPKPGGTVRTQTYVSPIPPYDTDKSGLFSLGTHRTKDSFFNSRGRRSAGRLRQSP